LKKRIGRWQWAAPTRKDQATSLPPQSSIDRTRILVLSRKSHLVSLLHARREVSAFERRVLIRISGPIVPLLTFKTEEEAIRKANDTQMGLGASVWSGDVDRANRIAQKIQAGTVWVNTHFELDPRVPFGGHKQSGNGSYEWGVPGLISFCNSQTLFLKKTPTKL
jgi:hypothetical protein